MDYFLSDRLLGGFIQKSDTKDQTGETRGGKYAARVQIGIEKDGSPRYRYFQTMEQYKAYLEGRGEKKERQAKQKKRSEDLKSRVKKERDSSKEKQQKAAKEKKSDDSVLLGGHTKKNKNASTKKSLRLYLGDK